MENNNEKKENKTIFEVNGIGIVIAIGVCLIAKKIGYNKGLNDGVGNGFVKGYRQCLSDIVKDKLGN